MKVFLYGAKGSVSSGIQKLLQKDGHKVFAGTRNPESETNSDLIQWVFADAKQVSQGLEILDSVESVFLMSPPGLTNQYEILAPWIEKAKNINLKKIVLMTAMGVEFAPQESPFRKTEILLENSGLNWNIIRPNWFMQNFHTYWLEGIKKDSKLYFPGGKAKASFIDVKDIANVAKVLLTTNEYNNTAFTITGNESLSHEEVAEKISKVTKNKIEYVDVDPSAFENSLINAGLSKDYAAFMRMIAQALKDGHAEAITDSVEKITGSKPNSFSDYVNENAKAWN
ncbi:NAD(P)H-binding protein [Leptospira sp. 96542]|nr:NAD(P)H-binding protein [Leptospira sp. 96542]